MSSIECRHFQCAAIFNDLIRFHGDAIIRCLMSLISLLLFFILLLNTKRPCMLTVRNVRLCISSFDESNTGRGMTLLTIRQYQQVFRPSKIIFGFCLVCVTSLNIIHHHVINQREWAKWLSCTTNICIKIIVRCAQGMFTKAV